ncbi:putative ATPase [Streptosporangium album]|uniref:Putative ATPase n=1 Tax=Streptosporangium album TaxID=47479 RepID=A0A7W7W9M9_9ACTN|nr:AAA family ATPase [Streptosporangium album]MBB4939567.1 putative ATPase [Streptosporangium album]
MRADVFVGREKELTEVSALLEKARHVTLTGAAGVGKSRLALHLVRTLEGEFAGGLHVVDLSDASGDLASLAETVLGAIGAGRRPGVLPLQALIEALSSRQTLLVLDTCDRVIGTVGTLVEELRPIDGLRILATSRQRLGLPDEHLYPVRGLLPADAVYLLTALADRRLDGMDPAELCERLDYLPLAIELAAASPDPGRADVFTASSGTWRHSSMRAAHGWSHELCDPRERVLWARASVFSGTFGLEAVKEVCVAEGLTADEIPDAVLGLLDKSVLTGEEGECGPRYRLPATAREFGAVWLDLLGETGEMRRRHRDHFLDLSARAEVGWQRQQLDWYRRLVLECANVRQAIEYCYARPDERRKGLELVGNLWFLWACCGMHAPGDNLLQRGLDLERTPGPERTKALWVHAWVSIQRGDLERAERTLAECVAEDPEEHATAYVSQFQAHLAVLRGDVGTALHLIKNARVRHRSAGNIFPGFLPTYTVVATAMMLAGSFQQAVSVLHEGRDLCASCGDRWTLIRLDLLLAQAEHLLGGTDAAAASVRDSLRGARLFGDTFSLLEGLEVAAVVAEATADDALAALLLGASEAAQTGTGVPPSRSPILTSLLRTAELRLRGRMGRGRFDGLTEQGSSIDLRTAVEHALRGTIS